MSSRTLSAASLIALWLLAVPLGGAAAEEPCFCLVHPTGAVLRGCMVWRAPHDHYARADCTDPETGAVSQQILTADWERIADGTDRCTPCWRRPPPPSPRVPRGGDDGGANAAAQAPSPQAAGPNP